MTTLLPQSYYVGDFPPPGEDLFKPGPCFGPGPCQPSWTDNTTKIRLWTDFEKEKETVPETMDEYKRIPVEYNAYGKDAATLRSDLGTLLDLGLDVTVVWNSVTKPPSHGFTINHPPGARFAEGGVIPKGGITLVNEASYPKDTYEENGVEQSLPRDYRDQGPTMGPNYRNGNLY